MVSWVSGSSTWLLLARGRFLVDDHEFVNAVKPRQQVGRKQRLDGGAIEASSGFVDEQHGSIAAPGHHSAGYVADGIGEQKSLAHLCFLCSSTNIGFTNGVLLGAYQVSHQTIEGCRQVYDFLGRVLRQIKIEFSVCV